MRSAVRRMCLAVAAASCVVSAAHGEPRPALIELFTSEGCSSCPPAEAYIGELAKRRDVLALSFHVDYWDDLGWRDRFALSDAVMRQRLYAQALGHASVYTPQIVIDGRKDYVGTDRAGIARALTGDRSGVPLAVAVRGGEVVVELGQQARGVPSDVVLVPYLRSAVSAIGRGENAGRTLQEFNIVRAVRNLGRWDGSPRDFHVQLSSLPRDATDVAVLVQPPGQAQIIGAASRPLQ
jgi:hypothetical protein